MVESCDTRITLLSATCITTRELLPVTTLSPSSTGLPTVGTTLLSFRISLTSPDRNTTHAFTAGTGAGIFVHPGIHRKAIADRPATKTFIFINPPSRSTFNFVNHIYHHAMFTTTIFFNKNLSHVIKK